MNAPVPTALGPVLAGQDFPAEELTRLVDLASKQGVVRHIVKTYVTRTHEYKHGFRKNEKISGFRPGTPAYDQQAVTVILRHLTDPAHPLHRKCWDRLYRAAAIAFVDQELPNLERLFKEVPQPTDVDSARTVLKTICMNALDYNVTQNDVEKFYELWPISRVADFDVILPLCLQRDEASAQRRAMAKLSDSIDALNGAVGEKLARLDTLSRTSEEIELALRDLRAVSSAADARSNEALEQARLAHSYGERRSAELEEIVAKLREQLGHEKLATTELLRASELTLRTDLGSRVSDFRSELDGAVAVVRALQSQVSGIAAELATRAVSEPTKVAPAPLTLAIPKPQASVTDVKALRSALSAGFKALGVEPVAAMRIHAALGAGLVAVVVGPAAPLALIAYGRVACGGRTAIFHVPPSLAEPGELFSRRGSFAGQVASLRDVLAESAKTTERTLVVVEGANRAPVDSYLLPVLQTREAGGQIEALAISQGEHGEGTLTWSAPTCLACTIVDGPTSLPLSRDFLSRAVVVEVESLASRPGSQEVTISEVPAESELWLGNDSFTEEVHEIVDFFPEAATYRASIGRFGAMMSRVESDASRTRAAIVEAILLPHVATLDNEGERDDAVASLAAGSGEDAKRLEGLLRRLRRRLG